MASCSALRMRGRDRRFFFFFFPHKAVGPYESSAVIGQLKIPDEWGDFGQETGEKRRVEGGPCPKPHNAVVNSE